MDRAAVMRLLRGVALLGLSWRLLQALPYPTHDKISSEAMWSPRWHASLSTTSPVYTSSALLSRCQALMYFNTTLGEFVSPQLALWPSSGTLFAADPAAGWAVWQELVMAAKNPWVSYWAAALLPEPWLVMPSAARQHLRLFAAGVPVLTRDVARAGGVIKSAPYSSSSDEDDSNSGFSQQQQQQQQPPPRGRRSRWVASCVSPLNPSSLRPQRVMRCSVSRRAPDGGPGVQQAGAFEVLPDAPRRLQQTSAAAAAASSDTVIAAEQQHGQGQQAHDKQQQLLQRWQSVPLLRGGVIDRSWMARAGAAWRTVLLVAVPTLSLEPLSAQLKQLVVLEFEWEWEVLLLYATLLLVALRNALYLLGVAYKAAARLGALAGAGRAAQARGVAATLLGMVLGLWRTLGYATLDLLLEAALAHLQVAALGSSPWAASLLWRLAFDWGGFELRGLARLLRLARSAYGEARRIIVAPDALLLAAGGPGLGGGPKPLSSRVSTPGPWPPPLLVPPAVDELPVSSVPRGFICPITQAIMRSPALLLHDGTLTPSSYERDAIQQWLEVHSTDPKDPGRQLRMRSVKLVHNGDLARAIEDWVAVAAAAAGATSADADAGAGSSSGGGEVHPRHCSSSGRDAAAAVVRRRARSQPGGTGAQAAAASPPPRRRGAAEGAARRSATTAAAAAAAAAPVGGGTFSIAAAGELVRQSSAALAHMASLELPEVAAAGLATLTDTTRRAMTRDAVRQQAPQHDAAGPRGGRVHRAVEAGTIGQQPPNEAPRRQPAAAAAGHHADSAAGSSGAAAGANRSPATPRRSARVLARAVALSS